MRDARDAPMHSDNEGLGALRPCGPNRIDKLRRSLKWSCSQAGSPGLQIEPLRKIRPLAIEHGDAKAIIVLKLIVCLAQRIEGRNIDTVLCFRSIDAHQKHAH